MFGGFYFGQVAPGQSPAPFFVSVTAGLILLESLILGTSAGLIDTVPQTGNGAPYFGGFYLGQEFSSGSSVSGGGGGGGGITFDATSTGTTTPGTNTSLTFSHTTGSASNRLLTVGVAVHDSNGANRPITGITYNGSALTKIVGQTNTDESVELWQLVAPASGTHNIVITTTGSVNYIAASALSVSGASQSGSADATATATGSTSPASLSITTVANNCWTMDILASQTTPTLTTSGATANGNQMGQSFEFEASSYYGPKTPAGAKTLSYSQSSGSEWTMAALSFAPAAASTELTSTTAGLINTEATATADTAGQIVTEATTTSDTAGQILTEATVLSPTAGQIFTEATATAPTAGQIVTEATVASPTAGQVITESTAFSPTAGLIDAIPTSTTTAFSTTAGQIITENTITDPSAGLIDAQHLSTTDTAGQIITEATVLSDTAGQITAEATIISSTAGMVLTEKPATAASAGLIDALHESLSTTSGLVDLYSAAGLLTSAPHFTVVADSPSFTLKEVRTQTVVLNNPSVIMDSSTVTMDSITTYMNDSITGESPDINMTVTV